MNINNKSYMYNMLKVCISKVKTGENKIKEGKDYVKTAKKTFSALVKAAKIPAPRKATYAPGAWSRSCAASTAPPTGHQRS